MQIYYFFMKVRPFFQSFFALYHFVIRSLYSADLRLGEVTLMVTSAASSRRGTLVTNGTHETTRCVKC